MEGYRRVEKQKSQQTSLSDNEIRVTAQGLVRNYISYALSLLQDQKTNEIVLKAMGQAINKAVGIAEIIKKRSPGLHQDIVVSSTNITDVWEPVEEGLIPLEISRQVSLMSITLSTAELNKNSSGYQAPYHRGQAESRSRQENRKGTTLKYGPTEDVYAQGQNTHGKGRVTNDSWRGYNEGSTSYVNKGRSKGWTYRGGLSGRH